MFIPSWLRHRKPGSGRSHAHSVRLHLDELEPRNLLAPASATVDVFTRFQDTVSDPPPVTGPLFAESHATVGPDLGRTVGHARAQTAGRVQSRSQVSGVAGVPGVMDPSAAARAQATQMSNYIVQGLPAGTTVALDATLMLRGFLESRNFASLSAELSSLVQAELILTNGAGAQSVQARGLLRSGMLTTVGLLNPSDFTPGPWSTIRTPHYDLDLTRTLPGAFTVTAGEVFSVESTLFTSGFVVGPFELFTTADFFTDTRGLSFTLSAPGATVVPFNDADLSLTRSGFSGPVTVGRTVNYTLTVTNNGPNAATGVTLTDSLHDGFALVSATPSQGSFTGDERTLVYSLGTLLPGQSATVAVVVRANQVGTFTRTANVTAQQTDSDLNDNLVSVTTTVQPLFADLVVTLNDEQDPVRIDRPIPYIITVTNNGPDTATGVTLSQLLSGGIFSYSSAGGDVRASGDHLTVNLADLPPGASVTVRTGFFAPIGASGPVHSIAAVSAFETDLTPQDGLDSEETTLTSPPRSIHEYTLIATGGVSPYPSLNNAGTVAFTDYAGTASGSGEVQTRRESLFDDGDTTVIAARSPRFGGFGVYQTINEAGTVAFVAHNDSDGDPTGRGIFVGNGGPLTTIADASGPLSDFGLSPSINNAGMVAFRAFTDSHAEGIFLGDGSGPPVLLVDDTGGFQSFGHAHLNDRDQVAFWARLDSGETGIFLWDGGTVTTLADSSGPFDTFDGLPSLNDSGAVAFAATLDNGESGVFIAENGTIRTVVDSTGPFRDFGIHISTPAINNLGEVAFFGTLDTGLFGIFTGPDPEADRVIVRGNWAFGPVVELQMSWQGLNDAGQVTFWARSDNGSTRIVRADPDRDLDTVPDYIEQGAPSGDGNGDGQPDHLQNNVTSVRNVVDGGYLTLFSPTPGTQLAGVRSMAPTPLPFGVPPPPEDVDFPLGWLSFAVVGVDPGQPVDVELIVPGDLTSHTWFKFGTDWYSFGFDGTTGVHQPTTVTIHGNLVTRFILTFVDGNPRGDNDGTANGRIIDPGGPALVVVSAPPTVESVVLNDGGIQRSRVTSVTVTFSRQVTLDSGAFELVSSRRRLPVNLNVVTSLVQGKTVAVLTFSGPGVIGGSLPDGDYTLTIRSDRVHDALGEALDGDGDGVAGGDHRDAFFRIFGDSDGDRDVDLHDLARFLDALGKEEGDDGFLGYFDYDGDGDVDFSGDLPAFVTRFVRGMAASSP